MTGEPARVLVVDDDATSRDILSRRLEQQGHVAEHAEDGKQALTILAGRDYDLVLLDIVMPTLNGYEVLAQLKADDRLRHLPVIMISSLNEVFVSDNADVFTQSCPRIQKFSTDGAYETSWPMSWGQGLGSDAAGNVYVANYRKRAVIKVTPDGLVSAMATATWPWVPVGVAISGNNIYALERMGNPYGPSTALEVSTLADRLGSPRIRKISTGGTITTLVVVKGNRSLAVIVVPLILAADVISVWLMRRRRARRG